MCTAIMRVPSCIAACVILTACMSTVISALMLAHAGACTVCGLTNEYACTVCDDMPALYPSAHCMQAKCVMCVITLCAVRRLRTTVCTMRGL